VKQESTPRELVVAPCPTCSRSPRLIKTIIQRLSILRACPLATIGVGVSALFVYHKGTMDSGNQRLAMPHDAHKRARTNPPPAATGVKLSSAALTSILKTSHLLLKSVGPEGSHERFGIMAETLADSTASAHGSREKSEKSAELPSDTAVGSLAVGAVGDVASATAHRSEAGGVPPTPQAVMEVKGILESQVTNVLHWTKTRCSSIRDAGVVLTEKNLCFVICLAALARGTAAIEEVGPLDNHAPWITQTRNFTHADNPTLSLEWLMALLEVARGRMDTNPPPTLGQTSALGSPAPRSGYPVTSKRGSGVLTDRQVGDDGGVVNVPKQNADEERNPSLMVRAETALVVAVRKRDGRLELCTRTSVGQPWSPDLPLNTDFYPMLHLVVDVAVPDKVKDYRIYEVVPPQTPFGAVVACDALEAAQLVWHSMTWKEHAREEPAADSGNLAPVKPHFCIVGALPATEDASTGSAVNLEEDITVMGPVSDLRTVHVLDAKPQNGDGVETVRKATETATKGVRVLVEARRFERPMLFNFPMDARAPLSAVQHMCQLCLPEDKMVGIEIRAKSKGAPWEPCDGRRVASIFSPAPGGDHQQGPPSGGLVQDVEVRVLVARVWPPTTSWGTLNADPTATDGGSGDGTEATTQEPLHVDLFDLRRYMSTRRQAPTDTNGTKPSVATNGTGFPRFMKTLVTPDMSRVVRTVEEMMTRNVRVDENALLVSGNPGIGKSTILSLILERHVLLKRAGSSSLFLRTAQALWSGNEIPVLSCTRRSSPFRTRASTH
jgi:hypothetical protein